MAAPVQNSIQQALTPELSIQPITTSAREAPGRPARSYPSLYTQLGEKLLELAHQDSTQLRASFFDTVSEFKRVALHTLGTPAGLCNLAFMIIGGGIAGRAGHQAAGLVSRVLEMPVVQRLTLTALVRMNLSAFASFVAAETVGYAANAAVFTSLGRIFSPSSDKGFAHDLAASGCDFALSGILGFALRTSTGPLGNLLSFLGGGVTLSFASAIREDAFIRAGLSHGNAMDHLTVAKVAENTALHFGQSAFSVSTAQFSRGLARVKQMVLDHAELGTAAAALSMAGSLKDSSLSHLELTSFHTERLTELLVDTFKDRPRDFVDFCGTVKPESKAKINSEMPLRSIFEAAFGVNPDSGLNAKIVNELNRINSSKAQQFRESSREADPQFKNTHINPYLLHPHHIRERLVEVLVDRPYLLGSILRLTGISRGKISSRTVSEQASDLEREVLTKDLFTFYAACAYIEQREMREVGNVRTELTDLNRYIQEGAEALGKSDALFERIARFNNQEFVPRSEVSPALRSGSNPRVVQVEPLEARDGAAEVRSAAQVEGADPRESLALDHQGLQVVNILSRLFPRAHDLFELAREVNVDLQNVDMSGEVRLAWVSFVHAAVQQNKLTYLVTAARERYPNEKTLNELFPRKNWFLNLWDRLRR